MSLLTSRSPKDSSHRVIPAGQNGAEPLREVKLRGFDERHRSVSTKSPSTSATLRVQAHLADAPRDDRSFDDPERARWLFGGEECREWEEPMLQSQSRKLCLD